MNNMYETLTLTISWFSSYLIVKNGEVKKLAYKGIVTNLANITPIENVFVDVISASGQALRKALAPFAFINDHKCSRTNHEITFRINALSFVEK